MGWMSWERFRCSVDCDADPEDCYREKLVREHVDIMSAAEWRGAGYEYINLDECWVGDRRDAQGKLVGNSTRFPSIRELSDYTHAAGLKFGMYANIGWRNCDEVVPAECDDLSCTLPGHMATDAKTFASWRVDSLKMDACYSTHTHAVLDPAYRFMGQQLNATGRPVLYSCSWPDYLRTGGAAVNFSDVAEHCNLWRFYDDVEDAWASVTTIADWVGDHQQVLAPAAGPGHWNDPDMLIVGNFALSEGQAQAQFALWSIMAAPLLMGNDLRHLVPEMKAILLNKEVIAVDQDRLGVQGRRVVHSCNASAPHPAVCFDVWSRPLAGGALAVMLWNRDIHGTHRSLSVSWLELGLPPRQRMVVRDLYGHEDRGTFAGSYAQFVAVDGVAMLRLSLAPTTAAGDVRSAEYKVGFGPPMLVGSSNFTHFWFPMTEFELGGPGLVLQLVRQGTDGGTCPPKGHPNWPCSAAYATNSRGSSWRMGPDAFPFPLLPESPSNSKRASNRANFSSIGLACVNGSCAGSLTRWSASAAHGSAGVPAFKRTLVQPLAVNGVPADVREAADGLLPIMLNDGSVLVALYGYTTGAASSCSILQPTCYSIFFFSCADPVHSPTQWVHTSRIDAVPAMVPHGGTVEGPCEPAMVQLPDGRVLVIFRVSSGQGMWGALSSDGGKRWGASFPTGTWSVSPNLFVMKSGAVVLTAGRPSIGLWVSSFDTTPPKWEFHNVIQVHNAKVTEAAHMYPDIDAAVQNVSSPHFSGEVDATTCNAAGTCNAGSARNCANCVHSCTQCTYTCVKSSPHCSSTTAYTGLTLLDEETLLLAYDRLANGWSGPPGKLGTSDSVFTMTVKITKTSGG